MINELKVIETRIKNNVTIQESNKQTTICENWNVTDRHFQDTGFKDK